MMKRLLLVLAIAAGTQTARSQAFNFSVNPAVQCAAQFTTFAQAVITATAAGATSYSWTTSQTYSPAPYASYSPNTYSAYISGLGVGITTVYCYAYNGTTAISVVANTLQVLASPAFSINTSSGSTNLCSGSSLTLSAGPGGSFTWAPGSMTGTSVVVSPTVSTCYTASASGSNNCTYTQQVCVNVATASPVLTISPGSSFSLCQGSMWISASGATTYSWSNGQNGSNCLVTSIGCYTVTGVNGCGTATAVACATGTMSPPQLTISASASTICAGSSATLSVTGANGAATYPTYYWYGPTQGQCCSISTATSIVITPTASGCYTLYGQNPSCSFQTQKCITVNSAPGVTTYPAGSFSTCSSNYNVINAYGASSYTWSGPGGTLSAANISVTVPGCYTVTAANACGSASSAVCVTTILASPVITTSYAGTVCTGSTFSMSASGATTYTWVIWNSGIQTYTTPSIAFTHSVSGTYCATLIASNGNGCNVQSWECYTVLPSANVTVSPSMTLCSGSSAYITAGGASSYSWSTGSNTTSILVSPQASACYTVYGSSPGCAGTSSAVTCVSVIPGPTLSIAGNNTMCANAIGSYTASGASSYSWFTSPGNALIGSGATATISPNWGCFVVRTSVSGCTAVSQPFCPVIISPTVVAGASSTVICAGTTATLSASGASTYTWFPGNIISPTIAVTPTTSTCYTLVGTNASGCNSSTTKCIIVNLSPSVAIAGGGSVCAGGSATLIAFGASFYSWSTGATTSSIVVSPGASSCYTVAGTNNQGCTRTASTCVTVLQGPSLSVTGTASVCLGTSTRFTVSGGNNYQWSTGATTSTIQVMPSSSTSYTVSSTGSNGCSSSLLVSVSVNTTCSNVWPGDANSDGIVDALDVFELGLWYLQTGPSRSPGGNAFIAQFANNWSGTISSGKNRCHADCNGDGTVSAGDLVAIYNNYSLTHTFRSGSQPSGAPDIYLVPEYPAAFSGQWNTADVVLGNLSQIAGSSFDLTFNRTLLDNDSIYLEYPASFINAGNVNLEFEKTDLQIAKVHGATMRTDGMNVSGNGTIARLHYKLMPGITTNSSLDFRIERAYRSDNTGAVAPLNTGSLTLSILDNAVGMDENVQLITSLYPNPAYGKVTMMASDTTPVQYIVTDLSGRVVFEGSFNGGHTLDVSTAAAGTYIVSMRAGSNTSYHKLVIGN